jgi:hypothetical protein
MRASRSNKVHVTGNVPESKILLIRVGERNLTMWGSVSVMYWFLAPEVGLEPTTLRLTATELVVVLLPTDCYKFLSVLHLDPSPSLRFVTHICLIMTYFEGAWAQKWTQSSGTSNEVVFPALAACSWSEANLTNVIVSLRKRLAASPFVPSPSMATASSCR